MLAIPRTVIELLPSQDESIERCFIANYFNFVSSQISINQAGQRIPLL